MQLGCFYIESDAKTIFVLSWGLLTVSNPVRDLEGEGWGPQQKRSGSVEHCPAHRPFSLS